MSGNVLGVLIGLALVAFAAAANSRARRGRPRAADDGDAGIDSGGWGDHGGADCGHGGDGGDGGGCH